MSGGHVEGRARRAVVGCSYRYRTGQPGGRLYVELCRADIVDRRGKAVELHTDTAQCGGQVVVTEIRGAPTARCVGEGRAVDRDPFTGNNGLECAFGVLHRGDYGPRLNRPHRELHRRRHAASRRGIVHRYLVAPGCGDVGDADGSAQLRGVDKRGWPAVAIPWRY